MAGGERGAAQTTLKAPFFFFFSLGRSKLALWKGISGRWSFTSARSACLLEVMVWGWDFLDFQWVGRGEAEKEQRLQGLGPEVGVSGKRGCWAPQECGV